MFKQGIKKIQDFIGLFIRGILGIITEISYAVVIMIAAFLVCIILTSR